MATKDQCVGCYSRGRTDQGRTGRTADQNRLIKQFSAIVKALSIAGASPEEIRQYMNGERPITELFESIREFVLTEASSTASLRAAIFGADVGETEVTPTKVGEPVTSTTTVGTSDLATTPTDLISQGDYEQWA